MCSTNKSARPCLGSLTAWAFTNGTRVNIGQVPIGPLRGQVFVTGVFSNGFCEFIREDVHTALADLKAHVDAKA